MMSINPMDTENMIIVAGISSVETPMRRSDLKYQNRVVLQVANVDIGRGLMIAMSNIRIAGVMMK
jgi:hypothetical protein